MRGKVAKRLRKAARGGKPGLYKALKSLWKTGHIKKS